MHLAGTALNVAFDAEVGSILSKENHFFQS
jgi:hypothetical protein